MESSKKPSERCGNVVLPLNKRTVKKLRKMHEKGKSNPVQIRLHKESDFYRIGTIVVVPIPRNKYDHVKDLPKNVVPVHILKNGKIRGFAFAKYQQYAPLPEMAKKVLPTVIGSKAEKREDFMGIPVAKATTLQIGVPVPPKTKMQMWERVLRKAEEAALHGFLLADYNKENISAMELYDPLLLPKKGDPRALVRESLKKFSAHNNEPIPRTIWREVARFDPFRVRNRLLEQKRRVQRILR